MTLVILSQSVERPSSQTICPRVVSEAGREAWHQHEHASLDSVAVDLGHLAVAYRSATSLD